MRSPFLLAQALALSSSASAFYIWKPCIEDGSCVDKTKIDIARQRVTSRNKGLTLELVQRARPASSPLSRRLEAIRAADLEKRNTNSYDIMTAETPSYKHSVGIDQDGNDLSYFISVSIGSNKTQMYMLVDTGAGSTWIMGDTCSTDACKMHSSFSPSESTTMTELDKTFSIAYGSGSVSGRNVEDSLTVGDISVTMNFGLANYTSSDFESFPFDGILGLSLNTGSTDSFTHKLNASSDITEKVFSVFLARASSGVNNGELTLGGINPSRYTGAITYTDLESASSGDWSIPMDSVSIGGKDVGISSRTGYIDTGTSYIFGPPEDVKLMHSHIAGANTTDGSRWTVPCDTSEDLALSFGGKAWTLQKSDWISTARDGTCYSYVMGVEVVSNGWLLGDSFIKNVYTVFDMAERRIGFAAAKHDSSSTASASGSTTIGGTAAQETGGIGVISSNSASATAEAAHTTSPTSSSKSSAATSGLPISVAAVASSLLISLMSL
ncbi:hypothetical protein TD95_005437 [Thielaviopsis punctulata]|uniref:Peptidase A1 domain-containing protein n=1 Tax=Thielaviopsis punctulata TaxID=72032 RepID=A0A0F4ZBD7_9PEZI|nr:hypothetical protein TD95_005437 [Thielaviopsis punctulata]